MHLSLSACLVLILYSILTEILGDQSRTSWAIQTRIRRIVGRQVHIRPTSVNHRRNGRKAFHS